MTHVKPTLQNKIMKIKNEIIAVEITYANSTKAFFVAHYLIDIQSPLIINFLIFIIKLKFAILYRN